MVRAIEEFSGDQALRVLALASQKGGSGKTTLSGHMAVQAQRAGAGPVVLIDIDPQGSLADWWNERADEYPAFAQTTVARLATDLAILKNGHSRGVNCLAFSQSGKRLASVGLDDDHTLAVSDLAFPPTEPFLISA